MRSIVTDVDRHGVEVKGQNGEVAGRRRTKVWAAGVQASPLAKMLADASGAMRPLRADEVLPDCTLPGHPEVFAIGDMMALDGLPGVAEVAMQSGIHAASTIKRRLEGRTYAVPLPGPRQHGNGRPLPCGRELQGDPGGRVPRVADVAVRPPDVHDRVQEQVHDYHAVDFQLLGRGRTERTLTFQQVSGGWRSRRPADNPTSCVWRRRSPPRGTAARVG